MQRRSRLDEDTRHRIARAREMGQSYGQIAVRMGTSRSVVDGICLALAADHPDGVRRVGGRMGERIGIYYRNGRPVRGFTREEDELMLLWDRQGWCPYRIAKQLGRSPNSVAARFKILARHERMREAGHELPEPPIRIGRVAIKPPAEPAIEPAPQASSGPMDPMAADLQRMRAKARRAR